MTGGGLLKRAKKIIPRGGSNWWRNSRVFETPSTLVHPYFQKENECVGTQPTQHLIHEQDQRSDYVIWLIDEQGAPIRRRGRTTCADIKNLPLGTRVYIELNANNIPCNIPESIILGSYLGFIARDSKLAPISFSDWDSLCMIPFKEKMLAEVESKFDFSGHICHWLFESLSLKWYNHKASLKYHYWNRRPIEKIMEDVPYGVDAAQWCHLVTQWSQPEDQINACELLSGEGLTSEDENIEANERVIMSLEYPESVRTQEFGVTPTRYFPHNTTTEGSSNSSSIFIRVVRLEEQVQLLRSEVQLLRSEMREFM